MYETAKKYSEEKYYTKKELSEEIDHYLLDPIWQEITTYRSFFKEELTIKNKPLFIIKNPLVLGKLMETHELLFSYVSNKQIPKKTINPSPYLQEEEIAIWNPFMTQMQNHPFLDCKDYMSKMIEVFKIQDIDKQLFDLLCDEQKPFLMRYFLLLFATEKRTAFLMQCPLLLKHGCMLAISAIQIDELYDEIYTEDTEIDITRSFIAFLDTIRLKLFHIMISLNREEQRSFVTLQAKELMERYPILHKKQIEFYVDHREYKHYYTIQNYMQHCNVCYETARYSLDQLVNENWYHKQKLGKKFVYYVM